MSLRRALRAGVASIAILSVTASEGLSETGPALQRLDGSALAVSVAQASDFSRLEFRFPGARMAARRDGQTLVLKFSRYARPDMTRLRVDPPKWLKSASERNAGGLELTLTLADDADARTGTADGAYFVNLFEKNTPPPPSDPPKTPDPAAATGALIANRPDPTPPGGVVRMKGEMQSGRVVLKFAWRNPLGAAVFRRGEAVWIVFDTPARIDLTGAPHGFRQASQFAAFTGADYSAVRIASPSDVAVAAGAEGPVWTVTLGGGDSAPPDTIKIDRDLSASTAVLTATVAGSTRVAWLDDPVVGDRLAVVTAMSPDKGAAARRTFVDFTLLKTVQGLALEANADDLAVSTDGDVVQIGRPRGLALSPKSARAEATASQGQDAPQPLSRPGLVNFDTWGATGAGGFLARYDELERAAANETLAGKDAGVKARMALARFLVGSNLSYEAIGVLNMVANAEPKMLGDAELRGLRGAAKAMAGRYKEAQTDFAAPVLSDDPASALWRGYIAARLGQWTDARQAFDQGAPELYQFPARWRSRFATANAEAATALGQYPVAETAIQSALDQQPDPAELLATRLVQARLFEAEGQKDRALRIFQAIETAPLAYLSTPATLHATQIRLAKSDITPVQAADVLEGLRYRWRGDATELEVIRALGQIYLGLGRYRDALSVLRTAGQRLPDLPEAQGLQSDLSNAFRALFLDGQADGLQPVQALALFYDFKELTPIGADGDLMVRKLARRLVDVDLLGQAADLLKYQADNRLNGVPRAEVATDLALIQLMNRQPEAALDALNSSRTTLLPNALNAQRRDIEARAWTQLGQYDHALEVLQSDKGADADLIRAEVAWKQHGWPLAGGLYERRLGDRWKTRLPLAADEETDLLRAAIAYTLANDEKSLARLRERYASFIPDSRQPEALKVALSLADATPASPGDFARLSADNDSFAGWVAAMKKRFRDQPAPVTTLAGQAPARPAGKG